MSTLEDKVDAAHYAIDMARLDPSIAGILHAARCMEDVLEAVGTSASAEQLCEALAVRVARDYIELGLPSPATQKLQVAARKDGVYAGIMRRVWDIVSSTAQERTHHEK